MEKASGSHAERLDKLPAPVRRRIDELKDSLVAELGDDLVCLLIHGSAARGEYREGQSDIDLMVVLKDAAPATLAAIANPLQLGRFAARIEAMVLTSAEIPRAADVFPLLYDDIRRCNLVLVGADPFAALTISDRHRRLRIEQELREAQIRIRRAVIDAQGAGEVLGGALSRKLRQLRGPLRALLALRGRDVGDDFDAVLGGACALYGVDPAALRQVREAPDAALGALTTLLSAAVDDVDRMDEGGEAA
jgi:predicted nucleotidyltransferase